MIQIQPVVFPLNLGTADKIDIYLSTNTSNNGAFIRYSLLETSSSPLKRLSSGRIELTEEQFTLHGNDKAWIENYTIEQLGITAITE